MSGICGIIHLNGRPVERNQLEQMAKRAAYRGPNGIDYHLVGPVGLACLSLDVTPDGTGACHLAREDRHGLLFLADARLDNREECAAGSNHFGGKSATDVELMLSTLVQAGEEGPSRLLGDFAYALWDGRHRRLHLARDAMGLRPLYYRVEENRILFASEAQQILSVPGVPRSLNERAVAWHLCCMQTPPGEVFYSGIDEVRPAEEVVIDASAVKRSRIFWQPDPEARIRYRDERDYAAHLRDILTTSVRARLRARDPVGISLSGGVDSTCVASVAGWLRQQGETLPSMRAYSWVFPENLAECDESETIYRIADHFRIPVTEIPAEHTYPFVDDDLNKPHEDDPFFSMFQPFMEMSLAAAGKDRVSTMFYGFRGDVVCGGSVEDVPGVLLGGRFSETRRVLARLARVHGLGRRQAVVRFLLRPLLYDQLKGRYQAVMLPPLFGEVEGEGSEKRVLPAPVRHAESHVSESFLGRVGLPAVEPHYEASRVWPRYAARDRLIHISSPLVARGVGYAERVTARHGIGLADPWSDRRIADFILACPQHLVGNVLASKRMARRAMVGIMPSQAIESIGKVSPESLYIEALRFKAHDKVMDLLTNSRCADLGCIDEVALKARFERFVRGEVPIFDLWPTLSLELWLRRYWA
ncbi:asparagine synthetase B family protein [Halomonas chromatireducens]|uniref:asparagine synthase (glutamine-hydrolyzing) n=1 Tax=Halomonas chromatireducens TaxID=507626 RepID=A0A120JVV4_9GAMM|nr:asparagine synthetase B [Halomonas chromatireducens]AMD00354.1 Asparagine synthetase [glutamine-hydrolyzing] 1 [Halomonas chromatireducens]